EFSGLQIEYSLIERTPERELLPMADALDIGVTAWSPLGGGVLTGKYNKGYEDRPQQEQQQLQQQQQDVPPSSTTTNTKEKGTNNSSNRLDIQNGLANRFLNDRNILIAREVSNVAKEIGCSTAQVALNWIR